MKKLIIVLSVLMAGLIAQAQPVIKLYGYSRATLPGMVPKGTRGNGAQTSYFVYLQHKSSDKIVPSALWLNGKRTHFSQSKADAPIISTNNNIPGKPVKTVLVPQNGLKTITLAQLTTDPSGAISAAVKKLTLKNELVVEYMWKGKHYYKTLKKLTVLEPVMGE